MGLILQNRQHGEDPEFSPSFLAESRQLQMILGNVLVQLVGCIVFFARVYSRSAIIKAWRTEDSVLVLAWVFCTGYSICQYGQIAHGAGRHLTAVIRENPENPVTSQKYAFAAQLILFVALALSKFSICLTYLRIFHADKWGRRLIRSLIGLLVLLVVPFEFEAIFQCKPISAFWNEGRPFDKCAGDLAALLTNGSLNVFVDVCLMAIVLPRILELQLHPRQRWALTFIVLLGSLAVVAGIVRIVRVSSAITMLGFDPSWDAYDVSIWSSTEVYVSLICAAAPGVKPVVVKLIPKILGSSLRSHTPPGQSIELGLSSKWKRTTIGSARVLRQPNDSVLATIDGPYTQVGVGVDDESLSGSDGVTTTSAGGTLKHTKGTPPHAM